MCGRITQYDSIQHYADALGLDGGKHFDGQPINNYNAGPGAKHWVMRSESESQAIAAEKLPWQWLSKWAAEKKMKPAINAKLEKLTGGYYRGLMKSGRIVVPADGWFEWTAEEDRKQPWYIRAKDRTPLFLAALTNVSPGSDADKDSGFVIVTNSSAGGMVDIHDRRPVALRPEDAKDWMDLAFDYKQAEMIARERSLPSDAFEWFRVSRDVNSYKLHDAHLIEPI